MKKYIFKLIYTATAIVTIINLVLSVKSGVFFDINELPHGEMLYSVQSPDGSKNLNIYLVENSLGAAIRGEVEDKEKTYNVFWQTDTDYVAALWADSNVIMINDMLLDITDSTYDSRRGTSLFQDGAIEGKAAEDYKNRIVTERNKKSSP